MPLSKRIKYQSEQRRKQRALDTTQIRQPDAPQSKSTPFKIESNTNPTVDASGEIVPEYW